MSYNGLSSEKLEALGRQLLGLFGVRVLKELLEVGNGFRERPEILGPAHRIEKQVHYVHSSFPFRELLFSVLFT